MFYKKRALFLVVTLLGIDNHIFGSDGSQNTTLKMENSSEIIYGDFTRNTSIGDKAIGAPKSDRHLLYQKIHDKAFFDEISAEQKILYLSLLNEHTDRLEKKLNNYSFPQKVYKYGKSVGMVGLGAFVLLLEATGPFHELKGLGIAPATFLAGYGVFQVGKTLNYKAIIKSKIARNQQVKELIEQ